MTSEFAANEPPSLILNNGTVIVDNTCLLVRKWWCFLLSSVCTFVAGLLIVLVWRLFAFLCCRKEAELGPNDPKQKEQKAARQGKQEFEGTFMTEAKDWAGELISGQTTTGRILVSVLCTLRTHPLQETLIGLFILQGERKRFENNPCTRKPQEDNNVFFLNWPHKFQQINAIIPALIYEKIMK